MEKERNRKDKNKKDGEREWIRQIKMVKKSNAQYIF